MKTLTHDAKGFVEGVVTYLRGSNMGPGALPKVQALFRKVTRQNRELTGMVTSAVVMTPAEKEALARAISKLVGQTIGFDFVVSPGLLGGFRVKVGDWIVDTSLETQLKNMSEMLLA